MSDTVAAVTSARSRWIDEGIRVLSEEGASGVRIDRIAARLGLSKGSFHHHFDGAEGYKRELLAEVERVSLDALDAAIQEMGDGASTRDVLSRLTDLIRPDGVLPHGARLDTAVRAWAASDDDARDTQARVDAARLRAIESVWRRASDDEETVRLSALLPYLVVVGATSVVPAVDIDDLRKVFGLLLPLVPEEEASP